MASQLRGTRPAFRSRTGRRLALATALTGAGLQACSGCGDESEVAGNSGGFAGSVSAGGSGGTSGSGAADGSGGSGAIIGLDGAADQTATCVGGCPEGQFCSNGTCVTQTACSEDDDCDNDTYCDVGRGCVPWGTPPGKDFDPNCQVGLPAGNFAPSVKCEFSSAPPGDPFPTHLDVQATPVVADLSGSAVGRVPSIIAPFTATVPSSAGSYTEDLGVLRILRGSDCSLEGIIGGGAGGFAEYLVSSAPVAVADLNGDGLGDIVAKVADGTLAAFSRATGAWAPLWRTATAVVGACTPSNHRCPVGWAGPSIHDLDDDGVPEVIVEATVVDGSNGAVRSTDPPSYGVFRQGLNPVLANLDQDAAIELTNGALVWEWSSGAWTQESYFPGGTAASHGFVAVADFGAYGAAVPASNPEIAVVHDGEVVVHAIDGTPALGPLAVPGGGGGSPTVADYDGDGLAELGVAGEAFFTVYDIDCTAAPRSGGTCSAGSACDDMTGAPGACPAGILWSRRTQDISSNVTGSSVFDFEDDGKAEVVYGDECFVRVYDGTNGTVLFSQYRSSCTWYENPIVADTDGNFRADLVSPSNLACSDGVNGRPCVAPLVGADGIDTQFPGLRCQVGSDCVSGICDAGLCRCTTAAECCGAANDAACVDEGYQCAAPPSGTAGTGNTCRAVHPRGVTGIRVYQDSKDSWVRSRTIWNQHAYHITHVNDDTTIPKTSAWQKNWLQPDLNNFRQNVPGTANGQATPDLTSRPAPYSCSSGTANLTTPVCNRGAEPVAAGISVGYYVAGSKVCEAKTSQVLQPGECESVICQWADAPKAEPGADVRAVADDASERNECKEGNNEADIAGVFCKPVQ